MANQISAEFIKKQQKKLEEMKTSLQTQIVELKKDDPFSDPDYLNDNAATDTDAREQQQHQDVEAQINDLKKSLEEVILALGKIENGRYGYCEKCNMPIPIERLELIPESRFCMACQSKN